MKGERGRFGGTSRTYRAVQKSHMLTVGSLNRSSNSSLSSISVTHYSLICVSLTPSNFPEPFLNLLVLLVVLGVVVMILTSD